MLSLVFINRATLAPLPLALSICCAVLCVGPLCNGLASFDWWVVECFLNFDLARLSSSCDALARPSARLALLPMVAMANGVLIDGVALAFALLCTYWCMNVEVVIWRWSSFLVLVKGDGAAIWFGCISGNLAPYLYFFKWWTCSSFAAGLFWTLICGKCCVLSIFCREFYGEKKSPCWSTSGSGSYWNVLYCWLLFPSVITLTMRVVFMLVPSTFYSSKVLLLLIALLMCSLALTMPVLSCTWANRIEVV